MQFLFTESSFLGSKHDVFRSFEKPNANKGTVRMGNVKYFINVYFFSGSGLPEVKGHK